MTTALLLLCSLASVASAATHPKRHRCAAGSKAVWSVVNRHGAQKRLQTCVQESVPPAAASVPPSAVPAAPASIPAPSVPQPTTTEPPAPVATPTPPGSEPTPPDPEPTPPDPEPTPPTSTEESSRSRDGLAVRAHLYAGSVQNPSAPNEVTWHYSASATQTSTKEGVETSEPALLPEGVLVFYIDGHLECETHVGGRINSDTCTDELGSLGTHEVEVIYSAGSLWSIRRRSDTVSKYPTSTSIEAVAESLPPQKRLSIEGGFSYESMEVGQLRITEEATPAGYPQFNCEGQPKGCLIPLEGGTRRDGSIYIPLWGQYTYNYGNERNEWRVGISVYNPTREKEEFFTQFPDDPAGSAFLHVVAEPDPRYYVSSSASAPLDLRNVHLPFTEELPHDASGGSVNALETPMTKVLTFGTYDKFGGPELILLMRVSLNGVYEETEGCEYEVRIDGIDRNDRFSANWNSDYYSVWPYYEHLPAGPHTFDLWVRRAPGAGPGKCALEYATLQAYEKHE